MRFPIPAPPPRWAHLALACAIIVLPIALRVGLLFEKRLGFSASDALGIVADLGVGGGVFVLLMLISRWSRILALLLSLVWVVLTFANDEYVRVFDAPASFTYVGHVADPEFLLGSAAHTSHPVLGWGVIVLLLLVARGWTGWRVRRIQASAAVGGVMVLAGAGMVMPELDGYLAWRQNHFALLNLRMLASKTTHRPPADGPVPDGRPPVLEPNLGGTKRFEYGSAKRNVLLVMVEGLSGAYLPTMAAHHGIKSDVVAPRLDALARRGMGFTTFFAHQRQTNRGEYTILCGDLPKLTSDVARMTEVAQGGVRTCLPELLREAGYHTAYLQAAPLAFMFKDQFMARAGFDEAHGSDWFSHSYVRNQWGVDDRAFFEQAVKQVQALEAGDKPWFLSMLTVGTHHPYLVPEGEGGSGSPFRRAVAYGDEALGNFLDTLEREGVLENTLVLLMSDESAGVPSGDDLNRLLTQNWIPFVVLAPEKGAQGMVVTEPFIQSEVSLSVLDYLGLEDQTGELVGRSLFRSYGRARPLYFSNTHIKKMWSLEPSGLLTQCNEALDDCKHYRVAVDRPFSPMRMSVPNLPNFAEWQHVLKWSHRPLGTTEGTRTLPLLLQKEVPVNADATDQILFGGQYMTLKKGTLLQVDLDVSAHGEGAIVEVMHDLIGPGTRPHRLPFRMLGDGDRMRIRYEYVIDKDRTHVELRMGGRRVFGKTATLKFEHAQVTIIPEGGVGRRGGASKVEHAITRSGAQVPMRFTANGVARMSRPRCARSFDKDGALQARGCGRTHLTWGPYAHARPGAKVRILYDVLVKKGDADLRAELVSKAGAMVHGESGRVRVREGERQRLEANFTASEWVEGLEARLELRPVDGNVDLDIRTAELEILP